MSSVVFRRESDPGPPYFFRDYAVDLSTVSFVWQYRAPRVEPGLFCKQISDEGIIYGTAPSAEFQLFPWSGEPPSPQGFYCAGVVWVDGQLQWVYRALPEGAEVAETEYVRRDATSVTIWDDPSAQAEPWKPLAAKATQESKKGRSLLGFARQHWRAVGQPRPVGCTQRETEQFMRSVAVGGPAYTYAQRLLTEPGAFEVDGELAGVAYTSAIGSEDLIPNKAQILLRTIEAKQTPGLGGAGGAGGLVNNAGPSASGAVAGAIAGALGLAWLASRGRR